MSCPDPICRIISCPPTDDLPHYYGQYSLQSGVTYDNGTIIVPAPGGGSYTVPPGTIVINLPPGSTSVNYQGCQSSISLPIPPGSSPSAIQAIVTQVMQQAAAQLAICNAPPNPHSGGPFPPIVFYNIGITLNCPGGLAMNQIAPLPGIVTLSGDSLFLDGGSFSSSVSESDANAMAQAFLESLIGTKVQCGYWNTEQSFTCPDTSVQTVPARTYFSTASQAAANALALAAAEAACSGTGPDWSQLAWGVPLLLNGGSRGVLGVFTPVSSMSPSFESITEISAGATIDASFSFADMQTYPAGCGSLIYNGPAANCVLTTINSQVGVASTTQQVVYIYLYVGGVFDSAIATFNMADFPNTTHDWDFTVPDTGGVDKQIVVDVQNELGDPPDASNFKFTIDGTFSNA